MPCKRKTSKSYTERPSPPYAADSVGCKGKTRKGGDGKFYVSKKSKTTGKYRWVKKTVLSAKKNQLPPCPAGRRRHPKTRRCRNIRSLSKLSLSNLPPAYVMPEDSDRENVYGPCPKALMTATHKDMFGNSINQEFCPSTTQPGGRDWLFYNQIEEEFRRPLFGIMGTASGNERMGNDEVESFFDQGGNVAWVTDDFGKFEN